MSRDIDPPEPNVLTGSNRLRDEIEPPAELEDRTAHALLARGLIRKEAPARGRPAVRVALAAAACLIFLFVGVLIGRTGRPGAASPLTGAETDLYAVLLYETDGYDKASGAEEIARFGEYSAWVDKARRRGQFVTGEDLDVDRGWQIVPSDGVPLIEPATSIAADAPLSGIFFIRADEPGQALELAGELPHVRHGGRVLVQRTIPTDAPPGR